MRSIFSLLLVLLFYQCIFAQDVALTITESHLIAEGITFDPVGQNFYISSIYKNKIIKVSGSEIKDFISSNSDGFMGGVGLHVDAARRILWACSGNIMGKYFRTGIFAFDLQKGKMLRKVIYPIDTVERFFNDLAIADDGIIYITDTFGHCIWKFSLNDEIPIKIILDKEIEYPNGIDISSDNSNLFVATRNGLCKIDLSSGKTRFIQMPESKVSSKGLDGIALYKNSIIGIQNGVDPKSENKLVRYFLSDDFDKVERIEIIDVGNKYFDIPTTLTIVKNELYIIANSQLDNLEQENLIIRRPEQLDYTYILKYELD
jgi:DNA-binding beta-propeller fold protein YncE